MTESILIVDDSRTIRMMVRTALEGRGYDVLEASNGVVALSVLARQVPDLLLTDINMPEMDGLTLIREARAQPGLARLPILVLTTEFADDIKQEGRRAGANGWLVKPFNPKQLCDTVALALAKFGSVAP